MEMKTLTVSEIAEYLVDRTLSKPQLTYTEACEYYTRNRVDFWIRKKLLKHESQNGKGKTKFYSHKKIIELSKNSYHF